MSARISFYYDFFSPYTYLAWSQLEAFSLRTHATIDYYPIDILSVMKRVNNSPTTLECEPKGQYVQKDLARWTQRYDIPMAANPHMRKIYALPLRQAAIAAQVNNQISSFNKAVFPAIWAQQKDLSDMETFLWILDTAGINKTEELLELAKTDEMNEELEKNNVRAIQDGVFGSPTFVVNGELFFGNDRLIFLEEFLNK